MEKDPSLPGHGICELWLSNEYTNYRGGCGGRGCESVIHGPGDEDPQPIGGAGEVELDVIA